MNYENIKFVKNIQFVNQPQREISAIVFLVLLLIASVNSLSASFCLPATLIEIAPSII